MMECLRGRERKWEDEMEGGVLEKGGLLDSDKWKTV